MVVLARVEVVRLVFPVLRGGGLKRLWGNSVSGNNPSQRPLRRFHSVLVLLQDERVNFSR